MKPDRRDREVDQETLVALPGMTTLQTPPPVPPSGTAFVPGAPAPQGSMKGVVINGRARVVPDNKKTGPWRGHIQSHLIPVIGPSVVYPCGGVHVAALFVMPRRAAEPKRVTPPHVRKPDLDKLVRAVLDAITGLIVADDSQVTRIEAHKRTAAIGEQPGLHLTWSTA